MHRSTITENLLLSTLVSMHRSTITENLLLSTLVFVCFVSALAKPAPGIRTRRDPDRKPPARVQFPNPQSHLLKPPVPPTTMFPFLSIIPYTRFVESTGHRLLAEERRQKIQEVLEHNGDRKSTRLNSS